MDHPQQRFVGTRARRIEDPALLRGQGQFAEYPLPCWTSVPHLEVRLKESPSLFNPLGVEGVGEGGTIPVAATIAAAVENALATFGVCIDDVPIATERIVALVGARRLSS